MGRYKESDFAEVLLDHVILESIPAERSLYHREEKDKSRQKKIDELRRKVKWHIDHSLSKRQKEVLRLVMQGKKEREIGDILGITQQVVNIYKHRAINKLRELIDA